MQHPAHDLADILKENQALRARLEEAEAMLRAIRSGAADALVTQSDPGPQGGSILRQDAVSGRKQAEDKLRRSEQLHRIAFDLAPTGLVYCAMDGRYINVNARMCEITGYTAEELLELTGTDLTHPDDLAHDNKLVHAFLSGGTPDYANEKRYVRKDGSSRWVAVTARLVTDDTGQPLHTVGAIRDIQERKRANAALHLSETRYRRLFEAAHDGILILDPATRKIVDANPFMTTLLGYRRDQIIGMELYQIGFLADAQASREMFQKLKATRQVRYENLPLQTRQGGLRDVEVVANLYDEGGHPVVQCNVRDITERRRAETASREHQHFLQRIFEVLPGVLYIFDLEESRVVFANNTAERTYSPDEIAGMGAEVVPNLMHPEDQPGFQEHIARIRTLNPGETTVFEYRMRDKADEWRWYMGTDTVFLRDEGGVARQFIGVALEITDRKRAEFALQESEARARRDADEIATIYATAPIGLCVFDNELRYQRINAHLAEVNGMTAEAHIGKTVREVLPQIADELERIAAQVFATGASVAAHELSGMTKAKPGMLSHWMARWVPRKDASGVVTGISVVAEEITERKNAEAALSEGARRQTFLLDLSDALRAEPSADAIANQALQMLFEYMRLDRCYIGIYRLAEDRGDFPYQVHDDRLPPLPTHVPLSDFPNGLQIVSNRTLVIDDVIEMEGLSSRDQSSIIGLGVRALINATLRKGENQPLWALIAASASPRVWTQGEVSLVEEVAERIWAAVERARAEAALQAAHDTFRYLVDRSPFGTYVINSDFCLVQISQAGQKAFVNVRPLIGRDFAEVVHTVWPEPFAGETVARFRHTLATGEPYYAETNERRADINATEAYDWKIERIIVPDGRFGVVCHFYDLSERMRHEEHVRLLMAEVNHRSKNMLGLVQAIAKRTVATHPDDFIERFGARIQALAASQDLLVKSEWKAVSLGELVRAQLAHFDDALDSRITLDGPQLAIKASTSQALGMALHELATNAAKYGALSNKSGRVVISWSLPSGAAGKSRFTMCWTESGGPLVARPTRRGFGSTVTDSMIKMSLGGDVEADYAPAGLVWRIDCPADGLLEGSAPPAPQSNGDAAKEIPAQAPGRCRVLIVEDEPLIAMDIARTLSEAGYDVIGPATSVAQALALIAQSGCDAAVLDTNLGAETAEPVARELIRRGTPFLSTSGYALEQQPEIMRTVPLLSKPLKPGVLIAEMVRCLGG